jgi:MoaA/NifB/PqqE/SkfB family radical SAM enzyme
MYKVTSKWPHQDSVKIEWNIGKRCNLDCAYCPSFIHDNFSPHTDIDVFKKALAELSKMNKPLRISFTGGEPCVHPNIIDIVESTREVADWINITTNGTLPYKLYGRLPVDHYVFSLHFDNEVVEKTVNNILYWSQLNDMERNIPYQVNLMAHHQYMDRVKESCCVLDGHSVPYVIRRIRWTEGDHDWFDDMRYDSKDLEWILDHNATVKANCLIDDTEEMHANDIIKHHKNQFKGWKCNAGIESLMINWDGEVHRATCRVGGSLGNIYSGTFEIPTEPITCTRNWCTCAADIPLTKVST